MILSLYKVLYTHTDTCSTADWFIVVLVFVWLDPYPHGHGMEGIIDRMLYIPPRASQKKWNLGFSLWPVSGSIFRCWLGHRIRFRLCFGVRTTEPLRPPAPQSRDRFHGYRSGSLRKWDPGEGPRGGTRTRPWILSIFIVPDRPWPHGNGTTIWFPAAQLGRDYFSWILTNLASDFTKVVSGEMGRCDNALTTTVPFRWKVSMESRKEEVWLSCLSFAIFPRCSSTCLTYLCAQPSWCARVRSKRLIRCFLATCICFAAKADGSTQTPWKTSSPCLMLS